MSQRLGLSFSHVGIFVNDIAKMEAFYTRHLEFTVTDRGRLDGPHGPVELMFLSRNPDEHHQIVMATGRPDKLDFNVVNQISMRADSLATLKNFHARLCEAEVREMTPVTHGNAMSIYFRDPEGNRLEIFIDSPWYVTQPMRVPLPIEMPEAELMQWVEGHARKLPGFRPRAEWRAEMARKMGVA
ncbi:MAG: glyoxalase [Betaproteobacteria bacterium]|nr:glyoxalase [Betaproteobacteria bacterium]